jgi:S-DNA-T family DNA segregation ATPase FtsK/SpoIIIE
MELQPWAGCLGRLATTPDEAIALFQDAIAELNQRAAGLAAQGKRVWEPSRHNPALVIVVDEYAELPAEAKEYADSVARRGRAPAVTLLAATQHPTQDAMGNNAVRSQMDVRVCLRVKERRDVDLILGQGSFASGWHAHAITKPGIFLISAPEHPRPERALGYLIDDGQVTRHVSTHARGRPTLDRDGPGGGPAAPRPPQTPEPPPGGPGASPRPETALWDALVDAGPGGVAVAKLLALTGMTRPTLYRHLRGHVQAGRAVQVQRGYWRAERPVDGPPGDGQPGDSQPPPSGDAG